jgi:hypothetical protein
MDYDKILLPVGFIFIFIVPMVAGIILVTASFFLQGWFFILLPIGAFLIALQLWFWNGVSNAIDGAVYNGDDYLGIL